MKFLFTMIFLLTISSVSAAQENKNQIYTAAYQPTYACTSGEASFNVSRHSANRGELIASGTCFLLSKDTLFKVKRIIREEERAYSEIEILGLAPSEQPLYTSDGLVFTSLACSGSSPETGGQINRLERSKDGQLFLRRYMLTSKCVNGQMRSFTTPLD